MKNLATVLFIFLSAGAMAQPTITSVSPLIDSPGTNVTINGSGFSATAGNNIVYFGATRATVNSASGTSLSVKVPAGATYMPVSVNPGTGLTAFSDQAFLPDYNNSAYLPGIIDFDAEVSLPEFCSNLPGSVIADIDGDGKADIIVANWANNFSVFLNTSTSGSISQSSFAAPVSFTTGNSPSAVVVGDIDGDGKPDVAVVNAGDGTVSVFLNTSSVGSISFAPQITYSLGTFAVSTYPQQIAMADVDGDGKPELAIINFNNTSPISVLHNTSSIGSVSFAAPVNFSTGFFANGIVMADVDGDGKPDIEIMTMANVAVVFRNTSVPGTIDTNSFAVPVTFPTGNENNFTSITVGDIDGDGKPDMAVVNQNDNTISILRNTSTTGVVSFAPQIVLPTGTYPRGLTMSDIDGDGKVDLAVCNAYDNTISIFQNTSSVGAVTFNTKTLGLPNSFEPTGVAIGDMDGDGKPDLVVNNYGYISVLRNDPVMPPPTITSVSPATATPGTMVTITGTNFNATTTNDIVYFGATKAMVSSASATSLNVTVPIGATDVPVTVNNAATHLMAFSPALFLQTYNNSAYLPGIVNFDPQVPFATGNGPYPVKISDLDGDGKPDMVVVNDVDNTISIYLNTSSSGSITGGSFAAPIVVAVPAQSVIMAIGDLDGDGKQDIVVASIDYSGISVLRNTSTLGSLSFETVAVPLNDYMGSAEGNAGMAIGDIDGDGKPDVVLSNQSWPALVIMRNTSIIGHLSFEDGVDYINSGVYQIAIADIDGDGKPDIIADDNVSLIYVWRNQSTIGVIDTSSLAAPVSFATGNRPFDLVAGDIDGDGKTDVSIVNGYDSTVSVLRNTSTIGAISFAPQAVFATGGANTMAMGDLDGDGKPDLAVANVFDNTISVLRNTSAIGTVSFATQVTFATGNEPLALAICDLDGDSKPDIAVTNYNDNTVSILRNDPFSPAPPPPTITSVSPIVDSPGTGVTITGTNFSATASNNIVYFGATRATVTGGSSTLLNVIVPIGATYGPVSVNNDMGVMAYSDQSFLPDYNNSAYLPGIVNFDPQINFATGNEPQYVTIGDLDGDGKPDMVVANSWDNTISVYRNISTSGTVTAGSFSTPVIFACGANPVAIAIGDVDGDGKPDMIVLNEGSNTFSVYLNTSSVGSITASSFATPIAITTQVEPTSVTISDLDGDGRPDIVVSNINGPNGISVFLNVSSIGSIVFMPQVVFGTGDGTLDVAIGDIDGDGKPDMAAVNFVDNTISILLNTSTIDNVSFAPQIVLPTGNNPESLAMGDIDGDGKADIAISNMNDNTISILRNTSSSGSISFAASTVFATGNLPLSIAMGDINGDGKPDLAVTNLADNTVSVLRNTSSIGSVSYAGQVVYATGAGPELLVMGDIDGDKKPDMVVVNTGDNTVSVLRNDPLSAIMGANTLCLGGSDSLSDLAHFGTWHSSNTAVATIDSVSGVVTSVATGVDTISYTVTGGSATVVVTVGTSATAGAISGAGSVHVGASITLVDVVSGGAWSASNGNATVAGGLVTGITAGLDTILYTVSGSCGTAVATQVVMVNNTITTVSCTPATDISTFAGNHVNGYTGDGGYATAAETGSSFGVVADGAGNVYISDYFNNVVRKVSPTGIITTVAGNGAAGYNGDNIAAITAELNGPMGLALDGAGNLYIADKMNDRVRMVNTTGVITTIAGNGYHGGWEGHGYGNGGVADSASLDYPVAIAVDCSNNIYIADQGSETVRKINAAGIITQFAGNFAGGYNGDGIAATSAQLNYPSGVAADCAGNVYIADAWNNRVRMVNAAGVITTVAGNGAAAYSGDGGPGGSASLWIPTGVTLDACGDLYICDWQNNVVRYLDADGYISTFAGNNVRGYDGDGGAATAAELYLPSSLAIDGHGDIYIADYGNYVVRAMGNSLPPERRFENGTTQNMSVCENQTAVSINNQMAVPVGTSGMTEHWTVSINPAHGTLSGFDATATSQTGLTTPSGLTYTPAAGYTGQDVFTIQISDGTTAASTTVNLQIDSLPNAGVITGVTDIASGGSSNLADVTGATNGIWSSSDGLVATVSATGKVTAAGNGSATIFYTVSNSCGSTTTSARVTVEGVSGQQANVSLVPNPNKGTFMVSGTLGTQANENVTLEVTDMLGQVVYKGDVVAQSGSLNVTIALSNTLANGMYMLNLRSESDNQVFHFVIAQ